MMVLIIAVTGPVKRSDPITTIMQIFTLSLIITIHFSYEYIKLTRTKTIIKKPDKAGMTHTCRWKNYGKKL